MAGAVGAGASARRAAVVDLHEVSKRYRLGELRGRESLRDAWVRGARSAWQATTGPLGRFAGRSDRWPGVDGTAGDLWALRDVTFSVPQGQAVGLIGRNGAGKSTLLKILTRITEPTTGVARTRGRVGSLLEAGTGFHPELTGRENIYLNGAILGMSRKEVAARFDRIVDFSEMGAFLDTPVKRYSSGMYLRLAFAVAAHLEPHILLVDEVLAVGDAAFQRRCLAYLASVRRSGRTVLLVSHDLDAVAGLCERVVWLDNGGVRADGQAKEVIDAYLSSALERSQRTGFVDDPGMPVALESVAAMDTHGDPVSTLTVGEPLTVEVRLRVRDTLPGLDVAIYAETLRGIRVVDEAWSDVAPAARGEPGAYVMRLALPPVLAVGEYSVGVWIGTDHETFISEPATVAVRIEGSARGRPNRLVQLAHGGLPDPWSVERITVPPTTDDSCK